MGTRTPEQRIANRHRGKQMLLGWRATFSGRAAAERYQCAHDSPVKIRFAPRVVIIPYWQAGIRSLSRRGVSYEACFRRTENSTNIRSRIGRTRIYSSLRGRRRRSSWISPLSSIGAWMRCSAIGHSMARWRTPEPGFPARAGDPDRLYAVARFYGTSARSTASRSWRRNMRVDDVVSMGFAVFEATPDSARTRAAPVRAGR